MSSKKLTITVIHMLYIILFAKLISLILFILLPKTTIEKYYPKIETLPYFDKKIAQFFQTKHSKTHIKEPKKIFNLTNIELKAIIEGKTFSFVTIFDKKSKKTIVLSLNEEYKGYKLTKIGHNYVLFKKGNKTYKISFKKFKTSKNFQISPYKNDFIDKEDIVRVISKKDVLKYKRNFNLIWKNIGIKEIVKDNKITGFRVQFIRKGTIFSKLGLKPGDIILKVNNKPLNSYKDAFDIYNNIDKYHSLTITIKRNNQLKDLEYEMDD